MENNATTPMISVLLPVHNAEGYIGSAIKSILAQTYSDFEMLIINDGSTDRSAEIILSFSDERIRYIDNEINLGLVASLNKGLQLSRGKYIARMDADDICLSQRFEKQLNYLEVHPEVGVLGTFFCQLLPGDKKRHIILPVSNERIRAEFLFRSVIAHPSVMMRRDIIRKNKMEYEPEYVPTEDYKLWTRMMEWTKIENYPEELLMYRIHAAQISKVDSVPKEIARKKIIRFQLEQLGLFPTDREFEMHYLVSCGRSSKDDRFLPELELWLKKIRTANEVQKRFDPATLNAVLGSYLLKACENSGQGIRSLRYLFSSDLIHLRRQGIKPIVKAAAKLALGYKQY